MKKKVLIFIALLCAFAQGVHAQNFDVWDGVSEEKPGYYRTGSYGICIQIKSAAQMAWLMKHFTGSFVYWNDWLEENKYADPYTSSIEIYTDIDMTAGNWIPLGTKPSSNDVNVHYGLSNDYSPTVTFNGLGHTIKIKIKDATDNYQGLFYGIGTNGEVVNVHVEADIHCSNSRLVGAIAGENDGKIENCKVSGLVRSDWHESSSAYDAKVGGIAGENNGTVRYCCVTANVQNDDADVGGLLGNNDNGTLSHCTFYGSVISSHSQDNKYVGDSGTESDLFDTFDQNEYDAASGKELYRKAIKYPYTINVKTVGPGSVQVSAGNETNISCWSYGETVTLTVTSGRVASVTITDADGNNVSLQGQADDGSSYWFVMPKKNVTATVAFFFDDETIPMSAVTQTLEDGKTYQVVGNLTIDSRIVVNGSATLILGEGTTLNAKKGIEVSADDNANLTIEGPGTLIIDDCSSGKSGIGAVEVGTITINGGTINVTGGDGGSRHRR